MSISEKDIKLLWGRAASRCAFSECRKPLTQNTLASSDPFSIGEQAHIVGENKTAARWESLLTRKERNSYANVVLLCPTHHTIIDKNPTDYPVERLYVMKTTHELWVEQTLSNLSDARKQTQDSIYAELIDTAQLACRFDEWDSWIYRSIQEPASWHIDTPAKIRYFSKKVFGAVWPGTLPELERALQTLSLALEEMINIFMQHSESRDKKIRGIKFDKSREYFHPDLNSNEYVERLHYLEDKFDSWIKSYMFFLIEVVKSANWLADTVRRNINPAFCATQGKFLVPYDNNIVLYEYTSDEKAQQPTKLIGETEENSYQFHS